MTPLEKPYSMATAFNGAMRIHVKTRLLKGAQVGTDEAKRAVLYLPLRGWYRFSLLIGKKGKIFNEVDGPHLERFNDFIAELGPWVPFSEFVGWNMDRPAVIIS